MFINIDLWLNTMLAFMKDAGDLEILSSELQVTFPLRMY